jgi:hypothetical protein
MLCWSVSLHFQLEPSTLQALNTIANKNTKDWGQANVEAVPRKLLVHWHNFMSTLFTVLVMELPLSIYILSSFFFHCPTALRRRSAAALRSWFLIPPGTWMLVCCVYCVLSGLCDELFTRPEESYRLWRVVVCDQETFVWAAEPEKIIYILHLFITSALARQWTNWLKIRI